MTLEGGKQFEALLSYLRETRGFDFSGYKRPTLIRRVGQRCVALGLKSFAEYLDFLQVHTEEFPILFDKILINVTDFFRDQPAWDYLAQKIVPRIVEKSGRIRIWSTGTASGAEAFTTAIIFAEALGHEAFLRRVKIYATDVDEDALARARSGYTDKELSALSPQLRSRYFEQVADRQVFRTALRRALIFGRHDLMQDAPISHLDLLICRNTLMYFTAEAQARILSNFHYALNDGGFLFLGRAEMLLSHGGLFAPVDLKQRIFTKVHGASALDRFPVLAGADSGDAGGQAAHQLRLRERASEDALYAQVIVDLAGVIVAINQPARAMFALGPNAIGKPFRDLEFSHRPADLRSPIEEAYRQRRPVVVRDVQHSFPDGTVRHYEVHVSPLLDDGDSMIGVSVNFVDVTTAIKLRLELERSKDAVEAAYVELESSNEELETTNEELQSTVEELETTNEELQSSNEELETMNEELEATNAELHATNSDLHQRTNEVNRLNTFLNAILGNISLGAVVLDPSYKVRVWNPHAAELWGMRSDEVVGEKFFDLDIGLPTDELKPAVRKVMTGKPPHTELEIGATTRRGRTIRLRVMVSALSGPNATPTGVVLAMEEAATRPKAKG